MNLSRSLKLSVLFFAVQGLIACGGGGGSYSGGGGSVTPPSGGGGTTTPPVYYPTHAELAENFVDNAWYDANIDLQLVKANTLQADYIVVYDHDYGTYDAYDIGYYNMNADALDYINANEDWFYYDLIPMGGNVFKDSYSGILFEEKSAGSKDLEKMAALKQDIRIKKSAEKISAKFGLSADRSREVARLVAQIESSPKASMTDADYDQFSKEILGSSITDMKSATDKALSGNAVELNQLIEKAAVVNGVGPEQMNKIIAELFQ